MVLFMFLEERVGKRKIYIVCLAGEILGSLLLAASQSMAMATVGQVLLGFGYVPLVRFGIALISDITKPELSERFIATLELAFIAGGIFISLACD